MVDIEKYKQLVNPALYEAYKCMPDVCARCAQERPTCCQVCPCIFSPNDIKDLSYEGIIALIETGLVSIDWFNGGGSDECFGYKYKCLQPERNYYFLRMRGKDRHVIDPAFAMTRCGIWDKDNGCPLDFVYRPKEARELIPNPEKNIECSEGFTKKDAAVEWMPYNDILQEVCNYYYNQGDYEDICNPMYVLSNTVRVLEDLMELAYEKE